MGSILGKTADNFLNVIDSGVVGVKKIGEITSDVVLGTSDVVTKIASETADVVTTGLSSTASLMGMNLGFDSSSAHLLENHSLIIQLVFRNKTNWLSCFIVQQLYNWGRPHIFICLSSSNLSKWKDRTSSARFRSVEEIVINAVSVHFILISFVCVFIFQAILIRMGQLLQHNWNQIVELLER